MRDVVLNDPLDFEGWRDAARRLRLAGVEPAHVRFRAGDGQGGLFDRGDVLPDVEGGFTAPQGFMACAAQLIQHRSEDRFDLMYRLLWRLRDQPDLMAVLSDADVSEAAGRVKSVRRAAHKMKAFVRFRQAEDAMGEHWVAWFEPPHRVLRATAPFFVRRFSAMRWSILTPDGFARWDGESLTHGPPAEKAQAPDEDEMEDFWRTYYASTFNPARLRPRAMRSEMPVQYWKNLPEAELIPELMAAAAVRTEAMVNRTAKEPNNRFKRARAPAVDRTPTDEMAPDTLEELGRGVQGCRRCPLWRDATQGVCGEGSRNAALMIVGEQPGDQEDLSGRPFVGPAGRLLDKALGETGLDRSALYLTNAVKHFKHEPRGKRRLHRTPDAGEVQACRWWLDHERRLVRPRLILALGATAGLAVLGRKPAVQTERGRIMTTPDGARILLTVHPAYLLRLPDAETRAREQVRFREDLKAAADAL
ncbi:UdgX family uracil-DNA binding protein [Brevundimonas diminuta]|uniref:UdgX family uracil-DNA binding protein n=1 Tax=Brevundimonas diminuta TaxID=293 RepID=UPI003CFFCA3B